MAACSSRRRQGEVWQVGSLPVLDGLGLAAAVPHDLGDVLGLTPSALVREKGEFVYGRRRSQEKRWEESSDHKAEHHGQLCRKSATGAREQSVSRRENRQADPSPAPRQLLAGARTRSAAQGAGRAALPLPCSKPSLPSSVPGVTAGFPPHLTQGQAGRSLQNKSVATAACARLESSQTAEMFVFEEGADLPASASPTLKAKATRLPSRDKPLSQEGKPLFS